MPSRQARAAAGSRVAAREQLGTVGEIRLPVGAAQVGERVERPAVADRGEDVVELAVGGRGVVDVVGDDDRRPRASARAAVSATSQSSSGRR